MAPPKDNLPSLRSSAGEVDAFLKKVAAAPALRPGAGARGRLIFAMDATASREPSWSLAREIQGEMFLAAEALGGIDVQLAWYGGMGLFAASPWCARAADLLARMKDVSCLAGQTQIERLLRHAAQEARQGKVNALVFVGDCVEEDVDRLGAAAGELALLGVPVFVFQEGADPAAANAFGHVARLTGGALVPFDASSAEHLKRLLGAVAVFAAGGRRALEDLGRRQGGIVALLTDRMGRK